MKAGEILSNLEQKVDDEQTLYTENLLVLGFEQIEYTRSLIPCHGFLYLDCR